MNVSLIHRTDALVLSILLFFCMIVMVVLGRMAAKLWKSEEEEPRGGVNSLLTALYALSGFILAFTFGMSGERLQKARDVVALEANEIGTAIMRADLYPDSMRLALRKDFKNYLEAVIATYDNATRPDLYAKAKADAQKATDSLWTRVTQYAKDRPSMFIQANNMVVSMNGMFDIAQEREIVLFSRVPDLVVYMLFICVLASCFIGGFTSSAFQQKDWIIITGFALITAMVVYTTLDLARPMRGIIKDEAGKNAIVELRQMFNPPVVVNLKK
jgi:hypothetical protein